MRLVTEFPKMTRNSGGCLLFLGQPKQNESSGSMSSGLANDTPHDRCAVNPFRCQAEARLPWGIDDQRTSTQALAKVILPVFAAEKDGDLLAVRQYGGPTAERLRSKKISPGSF